MEYKTLRDVLDKIVRECRRYIQEKVGKKEIYGGDVSMYVKDHDVYLNVKVEGPHGEISWYTPMWKDYDFYAEYIDENTIRDDIDYCMRVVDQLIETHDKLE